MRTQAFLEAVSSVGVFLLLAVPGFIFTKKKIEKSQKRIKSCGEKLEYKKYHIMQIKIYVYNGKIIDLKSMFSTEINLTNPLGKIANN